MLLVSARHGKSPRLKASQGLSPSGHGLQPPSTQRSGAAKRRAPGALVPTGMAAYARVLYLRCIGPSSASRLNAHRWTGPRPAPHSPPAARAAASGIGAWPAARAPAAAQFWFGFGPRYYAP